MDSTAIDIIFDNNGTCNFCNDFFKLKRFFTFSSEKKKDLLKNFILKVKKPKLKYDCIIGLSGGVDSSYTLVKAVELGLRPLAVHMDNGWNSELANNNIFNLVKKLNVDLYTHVIDWDEYKNSDVIDVELLYDNAMLGVNFQQAVKHKTKFILSGTNTSTEGMRLPKNWSWFKNDAKNIKYLGKKFRNQKLKTFPAYGTFNYIYCEILKKIKWVTFLDYFEYKKEDALELLMKKYDFKPYGYKHYESIFTRFYQAYILPKKFGVDKRKLHLSNLIVTKQLERNEAISMLEKSPYPSPEQEKKDLEFFLKKMDWSHHDLANYIKRKPIEHSFYKSELPMWNFLKIVYNFFKIKKNGF
jgi:N-acetyl sugar amidotransferase